MKYRIRMRKRRVNKRIFFLTCILLVILTILALSIRSCMMSRQDRFVKYVYGVPVYTQLVPKGNQARPGKIRAIEYIVVHETGNTSATSTAAGHSNFLLHNNGTKTSWHYTVDDHEIYHHIPDNEVAWHAGDLLKKDGGNLNGIGIELCVNKGGNFEKTFDNAAKLVAYLLQEYHLDVDDIKQHADFINKNCPETIRRDNRMGEFKNLVAKYMKETPQDNS